MSWSIRMRKQSKVDGALEQRRKQVHGPQCTALSGSWAFTYRYQTPHDKAYEDFCQKRWRIRPPRLAQGSDQAGALHAQPGAGASGEEELVKYFILGMLLHPDPVLHYVSCCMGLPPLDGGGWFNDCAGCICDTCPYLCGYIDVFVSACWR